MVACPASLPLLVGSAPVVSPYVIASQLSPSIITQVGNIGQSQGPGMPERNISPAYPRDNGIGGRWLALAQTEEC